MKSLEDYLAEARAVINEVPIEEAAALSDALFVDVREPEETAAKSGPESALTIPRGRLESRADPASPAAEPQLTDARGTDRPVLVFCNGGGRGVLATKTLVEMGYNAKLLKGGARAWEAARAGEGEKPQPSFDSRSASRRISSAGLGCSGSRSSQLNA